MNSRRASGGGAAESSNAFSFEAAYEGSPNRVDRPGLPTKGDQKDDHHHYNNRRRTFRQFKDQRYRGPGVLGWSTKVSAYAKADAIIDSTSSQRLEARQ